jgi:molybdopterin-guanine dinucleotide biosynthesis protein MobB
MKPVWLSVIGSSGSGKTTLLCQLLPQLFSRGLRVATVKHSADAHPLHKPGSDSERLETAGAGPVVFATPRGVQLTCSGDPAALLPVILEPFSSALDLILVEGWKDGPLPKIEVWRKEVGPSLSEGRTDILAMVTDDDAPGSFRTFRPREVEKLADFVARWVRDPAVAGSMAIHSPLGRR